MGWAFTEQEMKLIKCTDDLIQILEQMRETGGYVYTGSQTVLHDAIDVLAEQEVKEFNLTPSGYEFHFSVKRVGRNPTEKVKS